MPTKVIVIGLDGASFTLLRPWMEDGHLPYLKSLTDQGVSGPLQSSIPPITAPAWQSFMTGKNPGKHGVAWFLEHWRQDLAKASVPSGIPDAKTLWELLSADGKRSAVLNVPFTYPSPGFNGVLIGGFTTPLSQKKDVFYPPGLLPEIEERFGDYRMYLRMPPWSGMLLVVSQLELAIEAFLNDCQELGDGQFRVAETLLERDEFAFVMFYQLQPDRIQHWLWHILDTTHPWHDPNTAQRFSHKIVAYYRRLDAQIARLVEKAGENPTVVILSDHGFGPSVKVMDLGSWLLKEGYIQIKKTPASALRYFLWKRGWGPKPLLQTLLRPARWKFVQGWLARRLSKPRGPERAWMHKSRARVMKVFKNPFLSVYDIDWTRTKAYCQGGPGFIRINLEGREPQGVVKAEAYHTLRQELVHKLDSLRDPATGQKIEGRAYVREEIYQGKYANRMADIVYVHTGECFVTNPMIFISSRLIIDDLRVSGCHRPDGIFIAKGPALRQGIRCEGANIMDVAPTILYLLGSQVPADMDGRVLTELFEDAYLSAHPITYGEAALGEERPALELSPEDEQAILENLKGLGYID